jgi:Zn finger protein HypA/HybF involved in hydrogenase expression
MILYICKSCGYFRDITGVISLTLETIAHPPEYNASVTHCPNCKTAMYQVQKGDRLAVIVEAEKE